MEDNGSKKTKVILAVLVVLLVAVIAVIATFMVRSRMTESKYTAQIETAQKYLAEANYSQAIVAYEKAIEIDEEQVEPYLALANIYVEQEDYDSAKQILRQGYAVTKSARIQGKLEIVKTYNLVGYATDGEIVKATEEDGELQISNAEIGWNTSFRQKLIANTFADYKTDYGSVSSAEMDEDGYLQVRHQNLDAVFYYRNTSDNPNLVDETLLTPSEDAMPEKVTLDDIGLILQNFTGTASLNRIQLMFGEQVTAKNVDSVPYVQYTSDDFIARFGTDTEGNILSATTWNEIELPLANTTLAQAGTLSGVVVNALTGSGVSGASLTFSPSNSANPSATAVSGSDGSFSVALAADVYTITIECTGYITEEFTFTMEEGRSYSGERFVISPIVSEEARIVLEWGSSPADLDSHLTGTTDSGSSIHVYYADREASGIADLDLDDTNGNGPETTTIHDLNGTYTFTVVDYRSTGTMAAQGATVKVYLPGQDPVTITLDSSSGVDNVWTVFTLDHGELSVVNAAG